MKFRNLILLILFTSGCGPDTRFESPQPRNQEKIHRFSKACTGTYQSVKDSASLLFIYPETMIKKRCFNIRMDKHHLDTMEHIEVYKDSIYNKKTDKSAAVKHHKTDSILVTSNTTDTIFHLSDNQILKRDIGYYFLNSKEGDLWKVKAIKRKKDTLTWYAFKPGKAQRNTIEQITEVKAVTNKNGETTGYKINPSGKEFRKLVRSGVFKPSEKYYKQD